MRWKLAIRTRGWDRIGRECGRRVQLGSSSGELGFQTSDLIFEGLLVCAGCHRGSIGER